MFKLPSRSSSGGVKSEDKVDGNGSSGEQGEWYDRTKLPVDDFDFPGDPKVTPWMTNSDGTTVHAEEDNDKCYKAQWPPLLAAKPNSPNIVIIMTDDIGFGSASTFGGPAETPVMTKLTEDGLVFNRFHTTAMCSPTRASILTGRLPHNAATGYVVDNATGYPGYYSQIPKRCATIGQILKLNGYSTGWYGKNHNIPVWETSASGPFDHWPTGLGFERFYGFNGGDSDQYNPLLFNGTTPIEPGHANPDYHLDKDLADKAIEFIHECNTISPEKPFFLYYVPGAAHAPHQVPGKYIDMYLGKFDDGWDKVREKTFEAQKALGIYTGTRCMPEGPTKRPPNMAAWNDYNDRYKKVFSRMAEIYCGFVTYTDENIGRIVDYLEKLEILDNTVIIYIQGDNGGSAEGSQAGTLNEGARLGNGIIEDFAMIERALPDLGGPLHFNHMPVEWAWGFNSPMQWTKRYASHFGGTRNGMVIRVPGKKAKDWENNLKYVQKRQDGERAYNICSEFHHVMDILPTILEMADIPPPKSVNGIAQAPIDGMSMKYIWDNKEKKTNVGIPEGWKDSKAKELRSIVFEMAGNLGLYRETEENGEIQSYMLSSTPVEFGWEGLKYKDSKDDKGKISEKEKSKIPSERNWELYNLNEDFAQGKDVSKDEKKRLGTMKDMFQVLAKENNIFPIVLNGSQRKAISRDPKRENYEAGYGTKVYNTLITRIPEICAPNCKNTSFTVTAEFRVLDRGGGHGRPEGVIYSLGGRFGGFGLIIYEGKPLFVYKVGQWPEAITKIKCDEELGPGYMTIKVIFEYGVTYEDGKRKEVNTDQLGLGGTFTMEINGEKVGQKAISQSVRAYYSFTETLDIGQDTGTPLLDIYEGKMPFKFNGEIKSVTFDSKGGNLSPETKMQEAASMANEELAHE